jgi:hypothetical protein
MTARRPCRILGDLPLHQPRDEDQLRRLLHAIHDERLEAEAAGILHDDVDSQAFRYARDAPDDIPVLIVHPALTDYGPEAAEKFFRQAHTNYQPPSQQLPSPIRAGRRPRNQTTLRLRADDLLSDFPSSLQQYDTAAEHPGFTNPAGTESKPLPKAPNTSSGARKLCHPTLGTQLANNENQVPLRRKGTKRARRASTRNQTSGEENPPQQHNISQNSALLRNMRLRRAGLVNQDDYGEDSNSDWDDKGTQETAANLEASSWLDEADRLASVDRGDRRESAKQDRLQATKKEIQIGWDDDWDGDLDGINHHLQPSTEADMLSTETEEQWSPHEMPSAARRRTAADRRRSQLSSRKTTSQMSGRQSLQEIASSALLDQDDREYEGLDGDIANSEEDLSRNYAPNELHSNMSRCTPRSLIRNSERQNNEIIMSPCLSFLAAPILLSGQLTSVPIMPHSIPSGQTVFRSAESRDSVQRRQNDTAQPGSTQVPDGSEAPQVSS